VAPLPLEPGRREVRYMHLFHGELPAAPPADAAREMPAPMASGDRVTERLAHLEQRVAVLEAELLRVLGATPSE